MPDEMLKVILALVLAPLPLIIVFPLFYRAWSKGMKRNEKKCREWVEARGGTVIAIDIRAFAVPLPQHNTKWKDARGHIRRMEFTPGLGVFGPGTFHDVERQTDG